VKILVTGSAGFIGSHFVTRLENDGHQVTGVDLNGFPKQDARNWFRNDEYQVTFDLVIHCAALVGGRGLVTSSPVAYARNLSIDAELFSWAEYARPGRIIYVSSVAAYPVSLSRDIIRRQELQDALNALAGDPLFRHKITVLPPRGPLRRFQETDINLDKPGMPDQLYGWAKLTGELLASKSGVPVSVIRPFTVYGPGQLPVHPVANFLWQVQSHHDPVTVWGSGNQVRDFIHVDDVVNATLIMAEKGIGGPVNLCTGVETTLRDVIRMLAAYDPEIVSLPDKPEGLPYLAGNPEKLHEFYVPQISLEDGLKGLR